jgi:hypothetical protein
MADGKVFPSAIIYLIGISFLILAVAATMHMPL